MKSNRSPQKAKYLTRAVFPTSNRGSTGDDDWDRAWGTTRALHKRTWSGSPYCIANEYIAGSIGQFLRLPIPPFAITADADSQMYFSSLDFNFEQLELPPAIPDLCWKYGIGELIKKHRADFPLVTDWPTGWME